MESTILALSTAVPSNFYLQTEILKLFAEIFKFDSEKLAFMEKIYKNSGIRKRHSIIGDFSYPKTEWKFWGSDYPRVIPGMSERNKLYKEEAPKLAEKAARLVIERWGRPSSEITHIISVSCTGVIAPGIEFLLMEKLGMSKTVNRLGINFMGCFGAFKGLSVARAFANENPTARILLVCTELCSLHLQAEDDYETLTGNCIFADGSSAAIIGSDPQDNETPLWEIVRTHSFGFNNTLNKMSWEAGDHGYFLRLSPTVPVMIKRHMRKFVQDLLQEAAPLEHCDLPIHPGGTSILQAIEQALNLQPDQTTCSWEVLANYGNVSSATFLFVLEELSKKGSVRPWSVGIGFGPGLSAEGILLRKSSLWKNK